MHYLTMMIAQVCDLEVGDFVHTFGDAHIYSNHDEPSKFTVKSREPFCETNYENKSKY